MHDHSHLLAVIAEPRLEQDSIRNAPPLRVLLGRRLLRPRLEVNMLEKTPLHQQSTTGPSRYHGSYLFIETTERRRRSDTLRFDRTIVWERVDEGLESEPDVYDPTRV